MVLLRMALRDLNPAHTRTLLTILGIAIGAASIISLFSVGYGMENSVREALNNLVNMGFILLPQNIGGGLLNGGSIPVREADRIRGIEGVDLVTPTLIELGFTEKTGDNAFLVVGIPPENAEEALPGVRNGAMWNPGEPGHTCLLGCTLAKMLEAHPGDKVEILARLYDDKGLKLTVSGVLGSTGVFLQDQAVYIPLELCQRFYGEDEMVTVIFVKLEDRSYTDTVKGRLLEMYPNYMIVENDEVISNVDNILSIVEAVLVGIGGISMVVGGLSVMNSVMMSVNEKTAEIGILKTIGYGERSILTLFLIEGLLYSLIGGLTGIAVGIVLSKLLYKMLLTRNFILPLTYKPKIFILSLTLSLLVGVASSVYPSLKAARMRVLEAIRHV
ncbi:MAG TPA: ABC transporter permease [Candidatus Bathyarchaeota archaeon]|nr:ABC transporter permease [Candidatus Bathyarchaeota archaeon]